MVPHGRGRGWPVVPALVFSTLLVFGLGGALLMRHAQHRSVWSVIIGGTPLWWQVLVGAGGGLVIAFAAWWLVRRPCMAPVLARYAGLIGPLMPWRRDRVLLSLCAGVGEELFFRGALQYWMGIPLTALVFVALHGYLDPRDRRITTYGAFMTLAMMGLGWMADRFGLLAPMVAHAVIDVVLLEGLYAAWRKGAGAEPPEEGRSGEQGCC